MENFNSRSLLLKHDHLRPEDKQINSDVEDLNSSGYETLSSCEDDNVSLPGYDFPLFDKFSQEHETMPAANEGRNANTKGDKLSDREKMVYKSESGVLDSLRYVISVPDLCDITFLVGPDQMPVNGVKAILAARSRFIFQMILRKQKEMKKDKKCCNSRVKSLTRKLMNRTRAAASERIIIQVENHEFCTFKQFIYFLHCGSVCVESRNFIGLFCAAIEFDIKDLRRACWDYTERLLRNGQNEKVLKMCTESFYSSRQSTGYLIEKIKTFQNQLNVATKEC